MHKNLSDAELYHLCQKYGQRTLEWRRKFIGLLPEVHKRELHKKEGFASIFHFAAKLAGLSESQVRDVLNLEKRFKSMPALHHALVSGGVSVHKLARVVSIATPQNQEALADQVKLLSSRALETMVRDEKNEEKSLHVQTSTLHLDDDVKDELAALQQKGIDVNEEIRRFLIQRKRNIEEEKRTLVEDQWETAKTRRHLGAPPTRYVPVAIRKILTREHGTQCSRSGCLKSADTLHHTQRFALTGTHDPRYIAPLCKEHHAIAHSIDVRIHEVRAQSG